MKPDLLIFVAMAVAVVGGAWDVWQRRIPNWLVLLLAALAVAVSFSTGGWSMLGSAALHALIVLVVGMILFALRAIGAGDAKFYSAAALALPLDRAIPMLGWVTGSGFVLLIGMMLWYRGFKVVTGDKKASWTLPYGLPICCGFLAESLAMLGKPLL